MNLIGRKRVQDPAVAARLKAWVRERLGLGDDAAVTVMHHTCAEDHGHDAETVVGVLEPGRQRTFTIPKPLAEVTREDVEAALAPPP